MYNNSNKYNTLNMLPYIVAVMMIKSPKKYKRKIKRKNKKSK